MAEARPAREHHHRASAHHQHAAAPHHARGEHEGAGTPAAAARGHGGNAHERTAEARAKSHE
jgi:hypothetical protein